MIKNIIFDFGGVLLDLDYMLSVKALQRVTGIDLNQEDNRHWFLELFKTYEKGEHSDEVFIWQIQQKSSLKPNAREIIEAWNAMLLGCNAERFAFVKGLRKDYKVFLLSNSNNLHMQEVMQMVTEVYDGQDFNKDLFDKAYYSHEIGMRKPDKEIFETVLQDNDLDGSESLFIDDLQPNIDGAIHAGLRAIRHDPKTNIIDMVPQYLKQANQVGNDK